MEEGEVKKRGADDVSDDEARDSRPPIGPPTESKFKIPLDQQRPARGVPASQRGEPPAKERDDGARPPPSMRHPTRGPSRSTLTLLGVAVVLLTGVAMWTTLRGPKEGEPATAPATSTTTSAPSVVATSTAADTPVAIACRCLDDRGQPPAVRAKCVRQLIDDTTLASTTCLQTFLDDPRTQDAMKKLDPAKLTPEEDLILDAANAMPAKIEQAKALGANVAPKPKPPPIAASEGSAPQKKP